MSGRQISCGDTGFYVTRGVYVLRPSWKYPAISNFARRRGRCTRFAGLVLQLINRVVGPRDVSGVYGPCASIRSSSSARLKSAEVPLRPHLLRAAGAHTYTPREHRLSAARHVSPGAARASQLGRYAPRRRYSWGRSRVGTIGGALPVAALAPLPSRAVFGGGSWEEA